MTSHADHHDPATCALCGLPTGLRASDVRADDDAPRFCCAGCAIVHAVLRGGDRGAETAGETGRQAHVPIGLVVRFAVALFLGLNVMMFSHALYGDRLYGGQWGAAPEEVAGFFRWLVFGLSVPAILLLAGPQIAAVRTTALGLNRLFHALVLVSVGAAFVVSTVAVVGGEGELYFDTVVMLLLLVTLGRLLEGYLRARGTGIARDLLATGARTWRVERVGDAAPREVAAEAIVAGDVLDVRAGERVPVDARLVDGASEFSTEARDGGLLPVRRAPGDVVRSGELNLGQPVRVRAEPAAGAPFWTEYCRLARGVFDRPARAEVLAGRVSAVLLPGTLLVAGGTFAWWAGAAGAGAMTALMHTLSVLVVACPCAMGLATPVAVRLAVAEAVRLGALPRTPDAFESLAPVRHLVIDNTGTMTAREAEVIECLLTDGTTELPPHHHARLAALAARSAHPVARAIERWCREQDASRRDVALGDVSEVRGSGMRASTDGGELLLGSPRWVAKCGVALPDAWHAATVAAALDGRPLAAFRLDLRQHPDTERALRALLDLGCGISLLTGAAAPPPLSAGLAARIADIRHGQSPDDKVRAIESLRAGGGRVAMVGDGLNDLPALAAADAGIAVGDASSLAGATAAFVLPGGGLAPLPPLLALARRAHRVMVRNFAWVVGYNAIALAAAALGWLNPLLAAGLMALSSAAIVAQAFTLRTLPAFRGAAALDQVDAVDAVDDADTMDRGGAEESGATAGAATPTSPDTAARPATRS